ncbi:MAG: DNA mismatch repair endonuclease MutL [Deltaproteobacteria bacterium]|nr:MAG: DNA mismatch repair endonuclease MutL [Deltaproteobacteria bacterium]
MPVSARVHVLPADLADKIAAGEVVERPASALKELVENAIDAGAGRVEVALEGGGADLLNVLDDGSGIHPEDLPLVVVRHATSKLRSEKDLEDVRTLGFRGEALASLAAVARLEIRSRRAEDAVGQRLRVGPGQAPVVEPCGMPVGTQVSVRSLFAQVPARRKFLRSKATETAACVETMLRVALGHPGVAMRLSSDGRVLVDLPAGDLAARVSAVFERRGHPAPDPAEDEVDGTAVRVFVVPPDRLRRGRGLMYVVVRGRVVEDRSLHGAVRSALAPFVPEGAGAVAAVYVDPPPGAVDVNVHPQKTEVRFADPQAVLHAVRTVLARLVARRSVGMGAPSSPNAAAPVVRAETMLRAAERDGVAPRYRLATKALSPEGARTRRDTAATVSGLLEGPSRRAGERPSKRAGAAARPGGGSGAPAWIDAGRLGARVALFVRNERLYVVDLPVLRTHLVERRLLAELAGGSVASQGLLLPVVVEASAAEVRQVEAVRAELARLGFEIDVFGEDALAVRAVPAAAGPWDEVAVRRAVARLAAWARLAAADRADLAVASSEVAASTDPGEVGAKTIRAWLDEAGADEDGARVPGVHVYEARDLLGRKGGSP